MSMAESGERLPPGMSPDGARFVWGRAPFWIRVAWRLVTRPGVPIGLIRPMLRIMEKRGILEFPPSPDDRDRNRS